MYPPQSSREDTVVKAVVGEPEVTLETTHSRGKSRGEEGGRFYTLSHLNAGDLQMVTAMRNGHQDPLQPTKVGFIAIQWCSRGLKTG